MKTAVEWFVEEMFKQGYFNDKPMTVANINYFANIAKEMEKNDTDNKVIHFAEWLTKKHTSTLITLYEHFEEEYYNETFKSE
jgi:hypothetical protein